jgi:hypothetical protein
MSISSPAEQSLSLISKTVFDNQLYILPLYSIREGGACSCGKADCGAPGKHPLFRYNWKIIATNDQEKIKNWFQAYNKMNFGLATGRYSKITEKYLIVIDVDAPEHEVLNHLPETFCYRTGSGGWHLWYWSKYPIKNSVSLFADKVDVRGTDGYVVIPPSKHKKGSYASIKNVPIADLPESVMKLLLNKQKKPKEKSDIKTKVKTTTVLTSSWNTEPIRDLRDKFSLGIKVPEGVRNVVMHRLLSSDRARGALKNELEINAQNYLQYFDNPATLASELEIIVESVLKYPAYNNSHEKVNELYVSWLKKNTKSNVPNDLLDKLDQIDNEFFSNLKPCDSKSGYCTLENLMSSRITYMSLRGFTKISVYKTQLFAKKLLDLGFTKRRTAKGNFWNITLDNAISS